MRKSIFYIGLLAALLATGVSCKKKEETTKPSLTGLALKADNTTFMAQGATVHAKANLANLQGSDSKTLEKIGLSYYVTGGKRDTLTFDALNDNPEYVFSTGEPGNYTLTCYAWDTNDAYYSTSASVSFTVLDPETAITGIEPEGETELNGNTYNTCTTGGFTWLAGNLYGTAAGKNYENSEILASVFGKYYTWEEAQKACPEGWHLPSAEEFDALLGEEAGDLMVNAVFNKKNMWEYWPQVKITNESGFNAIPVGYQDYTDETSPEEGFLKYACFWTSDQTTDDLGVFRYIYCEDSDVKKGQGSKTTLGMSVRCVTNSED